MKNGWQTKQLGDLCDVLDHKRKPITKRDRVAGEYPYYGATGVLDHVDGYLFDEPLVLVGEDGAKWESGENTAFAVQGKIWVNNHAHVLRPHRTKLLDNWLIYQLNHSDLTEFVSGLTVPKLNQGSLREIPIPLPPLPEQQRIVGILDEAFEGIATAKANAEKNLQNARAIFESHLQSVFTQRGEGWVETTLDDVCQQITDGKHGDCEDEVGSGFYFLSAKDVKAGTLNYKNARQITRDDFEETHRRTNLEAGDILITNSGTIGRMAIAPSDGKTTRTTFQKSVAILKPVKATIDSQFAFYCLSSGLTRFVNLSAGAAQKNLLLRDLRSYRFALPRSLDQQRVVATKLDSLSDETQRLAGLYEQKLAALEALKKSLLHQAFSGQL